MVVWAAKHRMVLFEQSERSVDGKCVAQDGVCCDTSVSVLHGYIFDSRAGSDHSRYDARRGCTILGKRPGTSISLIKPREE